MTTLEQEIIEKFHQLDDAAQERVLAQLLSEEEKPFDYGKWWAEVERLQASIRARAGGSIDALSLLDELREEFYCPNLQG